LGRAIHASLGPAVKANKAKDLLLEAKREIRLAAEAANGR
jgi:hypothetical protein